MTQSQFLVFTALPAGLTQQALKLSVFVTAKLQSTEPDSKLSNFGPWTNWPAALKELRFSAYVRRRGEGPFAVFDLSDIPIGSEDAWRRIFTPDTPVNPAPVQSSGTPASYDVAEIKEAVRDLYTRHVSRSPGISARPTRFDDVRRYSEEELRRGIRISAAADPTASAFRSIQAFHLPARSVVATMAADMRNPDFNTRMSAVGQYPHLLKLLNLAIEFRIPADRLAFGDYEVAVVPTGPETLFGGVDTKIVSPWTSCRRGAFGAGAEALEFFRPIAKDGTADGLIDLRKSRYVVAIEDIDGAAFNVLDFLERSRALRASPTPGAFQDALPAVRNKGIQFFDTETADEIAAAKTRSEELAREADAAAVTYPPNAPMLNAPTLWWDDLIRGHRIDARREDGPWRSLCARRSTFDISAAEHYTAEEEGFVSLALTNANTATGSDQKTSQVLFRWNGWSLVAPRPGAAVAEDGTPVHAPTRSFLPIGDKAVPGSLESLRFGMRVRFRARSADLAGNSWPLAGPEFAALGDVWREGSALVHYLRHEPVLPPKVPILPENGTTNLFVGLGSAEHTKAGSSVTLSPPLANVDLVERHGVFDHMSPERSYALLKRTARLPNGKVGAAFVDPAYAGAVVRETWPRQMTHGILKSDRTILDTDATPINISAKSGGYEIRLSGHQVIASVPPGGAMRLQIATYISPRFRKLFETYGASAENESSEAYELIAPSETITVVHPVEKPLTAPSFGQSKDIDIPVVHARRSFGDTHVGFDDPGFAVAAESTGRFDVTAEWTEVSDAPIGSDWPTRNRRRARLFGADVPLPPNHPLATVAALTRSSLAARSLVNAEDSVYDFRDSKYRRLNLTAAGVSRFQDLYKKTPKDAPDRFTRQSEVISVDVPNSKPPKSPNVSYIVPTDRASFARKAISQRRRGQKDI